MLQGVQRVSKFREQARNTVLVYMAVLRLPSVDSDIVIHYNYPALLAPASSSAAVASARSEGGQASGGVTGNEKDERVSGVANSTAHNGFRRMLSTLRIR
jgi:hypothetical protein